MPDQPALPPPHEHPADQRALPAPHDEAPATSPEPPPYTPEHSQTHGDLAMRMLYDEQARLRAELDALKQKNEKDKGSGEEKGGGDGKGDDKKGDDREGGDEKGEGKDKQDGKKEGDDKDKEKEQKPPLKERAGGWVREHPGTSVLILVGLIVLIIAGILLWRYLSSYEDTDDAFIDGHTDPISARISGHVASVYVENTFHVKKGQLLLEIDPRDLQISKEQAASNLAQAQASVREQSPNVPITDINQTTQIVTRNYDVERAQANVLQQQEQYRSALANLREAEANERNAKAEEERYRLLVAKEEVSREQYDQRLTQEVAQAAVVAARREQADATQKNVVQALAQLEQTKAQARQAELDRPKQVQMQKEQLAMRVANAQMALAQANQAELNLEYTRIYAPEDGIVGDKQVQVATQVAPGQELFAITQTNDIWVTANFKETQIQHMYPNQSVRIHVDALNMDFNGYIEQLPGATGAVYSLLPPENATGNYVKVVQRLPVRIRFYPNQPGEERLAPGMSVEPKVWVK